MPLAPVSPPTKTKSGTLQGLYVNGIVAYKVTELRKGYVRWTIYNPWEWVVNWGASTTKDKALSCVRTELELRGFRARWK